MYSRILVPVDGSPTLMSGPGEAVRVAKLTGASICLMHVLDAWSHTRGLATPAVYCDEVLPFMKREGMRILEETGALVVRDGRRRRPALRKSRSAHTQVTQQIQPDQNVWLG